jgi:hypothetical protein
MEVVGCVLSPVISTRLLCQTAIVPSPLHYLATIRGKPSLENSQSEERVRDLAVGDECDDLLSIRYSINCLGKH